MDQFPVEILVRIFEQACFDDKRTARSLSLASKVLAKIAEPIRFEAVSLYGSSQICGFASFLKKFPEHSGRIKHLFISGITPKEAEELREVRVCALKELAVRRGFADETQAVVQQPGFKLATKELERRVRRSLHCSTASTPIDEMYQIIRDVAQSLETLFIASIRSDYFTCFPCSLPNLTVLSATSGSYSLTITHILPKLKRIHTNCYLDEWDDDGQESIRFRIGAPVLEELRLIDIIDSSYHDGSLVEHLVQHARCMEDGREGGLLFPDTMQRIVVQQGPPVYDYRCAICDCAPYEEFASDVSSAAVSMAESQYRRDGFSLLVLEPLDVPYCFEHERAGLGYFFEDARSDWICTISGDR